MATRRVPPQPDETDTVGFHDDAAPPINPLSEIEIESDNLVARTRAIIAENPGDQMTVKLYRFPENGTRVFCANYSPEKFAQGDLEMVRQEWGHGRFEIRVIGPKGLADRPREFHIAERLGNSAPAPRDMGGGELSQVLRMLAESNAQILRALSDRAPAPPPADPLAQFQQFASIMRDLAPAPNPAPVAPVQSASSMLADLMGAMKALKEVAAETAPPAPSDDPMAMLPSVLEIVKGAMQQRNGGQQVNTGAGFPMIETPGSFAAAQNPAPEFQQPQTDNDQMNITGALVLRGLLQQLVNMAAAKQAPETGGLFIYEKMPDEFVQYLELPNWFEIVESFEPLVSMHREWLEKAKHFADLEFAKPDEDDTPGP
jgi:hypothetical protein